MTAKTATITLDGEGLRFVAESGSGHALVLDDGRGDTGMRPAELIPMAIAGCTAMDVISILRKKRQVVAGYRVLASGTQQDDHPNAFTRIDVIHVIDGESIDTGAVRRAIELSATKYCSVGATLSSGLTEVHHRFVVRSGDGEERAEEVIVTGPHQSTCALIESPLDRPSGASRARAQASRRSTIVAIPWPTPMHIVARP